MRHLHRYQSRCRMVEQRHRLFLGKMQPQFLHDLVVVRAYRAELRMKIGQFGVVIHQRLVHFQHFERLPEEVRFQEDRLGVNARLLEHGEETVVFLLAETDGVAEHRRIEFGISPAFVSSFFTHITLDLAV